MPDRMPQGRERPAMIDLHCHLLPGLDDGARTHRAAWAMAQAAVAAGVGQIVCTPHCTADDRGLAGRIARIRRSVEELNRELVQMGVPLRLHTGMELMCSEKLPQTVERGEVLTLAGSRYLLIEFLFDASRPRIERAADQVRRRGYIPVLAHPERYTAVQRDPSCLADWFYADCVLQLDQDSVLGRFGSRCARTANWALECGLAHVVASDAHDTQCRTISLDEVWHHLRRRYAPGYAELLLWRNPRRILENRALVAPDEF